MVLTRRGQRLLNGIAIVVLAAVTIVLLGSAYQYGHGRRCDWLRSHDSYRYGLECS